MRERPAGTMRVLVTGATRGIGRQIVEALSHENHTIFLGCRDLRAGAALATQLGGGAATVQPLELDVSSTTSISAAATVVEAAGLDALVNNAGVLLERHGVEKADVIEPTLTVNVDGVIKVTEAFAPLISDNGHIINVSSGAGTRAAGKMSDAERDELACLEDATVLRTVIARHAQAAAGEAQHRPGDTPVYAISKAGVNFYSQLSARALGPRLRVNACSPGFCQTEIAGPSADYSQREPKSARLGADVVLKLLSGEIGVEKTGRFFKENSRPGTPLQDAQSVEQDWVA